MIEVITGSAPFDGPEPCPVGQGRYGLDDQMRAMQDMLPGMGVSREDTTSNANKRNFYKYGHASARPEFYGVLTTKGPAPQLTVKASTNNADTVSVIYEGYAPCLLAPGQVVKPGQWIEPIPSGSNQALFRLASGGKGVAQVRDYLSNTTEQGQWVGADIIKAPAASGLIAAVGPSAALVGVTIETVYNKTVPIPANTLRVGDRLRFVSIVKADNSALGSNTVKGYINGLGSGVLFAAPATSFTAGDTVLSFIDAYVASIGVSGSLSLAGQLTTGTIGTATARASASALTINTTIDNVVSVASTPNNVLDSSTLLFLSVEKLA